MVSIPPGSALGRYRVIEQLGRGGMATVFRCHDPNLDRYVAVKVLPSYYTEDPTFVARFTQEAQTVGHFAAIRRILSRAVHHLSPDGILIGEVGNSWNALDQTFPGVPFTWIELERGGHGVFVLTARELAESGASFA